MKFTSAGLEFKYHGDILTRRWPWVIGTRYFGNGQDYLSLRDYWQQVGAYEQALRSKKLCGYVHRDIVLEWAKYKYPKSIIVVMMDINKNVKNSNFWKSIPSTYRMELLKDVVVLFFSDRDKAIDVVHSMDQEFAECHMIDGDWYLTNVGDGQRYINDQSGLQRHEE